MDFALTPEQRALRTSIARFARSTLSEGALERDQTSTLSGSLWTQCASVGLHGLLAPIELGGQGADHLTTAIALEALGEHCPDHGLVFSLCAQLVACTAPIARYGTDEQKQKYLPRLSAGEWIGANAMTEDQAGSDVFSMKTTAVRTGNELVLTGRKTFCTNAPVADFAIVFALTHPDKRYFGGITAFLVDCNRPGVSRGQSYEKMGLRTSPIGEIILDEVRLTDDDVLGGIGGGGPLVTETMNCERSCLFAAHVGQMQRILRVAAQYATDRKQFGAPIATYQAVSHRLADMRVRIEAARLLVYRSAWGLDSDTEPRGDTTLHASIAKLFTSEALVECAREAVQILGGNGYMVEYEIERVLRDAIGSTIYSGTSEMQREIIARSLGGDEPA